MLAASPEMLEGRYGELETFHGVLADADAQIYADPNAAMEIVSAFMQGSMSAPPLILPRIGGHP